LGLSDDTPTQATREAQAVLEDIVDRKGLTGDKDFSFKKDGAGNVVRARGRVTGPHKGRAKGLLPEPIGGRIKGEDRGHMVPEGGVETPSKVNVPENLNSEAVYSNRGPKRIFDRRASEIAAENSDSVIETVHEPLRKAGETRPFAVTHYILKDGVPVYAETIFNQ
jgi:hypothetical protein